MTGDRLESLRRVAGDVSRETFLTLVELEATFEKWARRINLVAPGTLPNLWTRHVLDSAQLAPLVPNGARLTDLGSGGGFPSLVLAILIRERGGRVTMVESNGKKAAFLRQASSRLVPDSTEVVCARVEDVVKSCTAPDIVTARAFASLDVILRLTRPWTMTGTRLLLHKGRDYRNEIAQADDVKHMTLLEVPSKIDTESVILDISGRG